MEEQSNVAAWLSAALVPAALILLAMMPGLFLIALFGGAGGIDEPIVYESFTVNEDGRLSWPIAGYGTESITSPYGRRVSPGWVGSTYHRGIDIGAPSGTLIHAAAEGTITISAYHTAMGNYVEIDHGDGLKTRYEHMSRRLCSVGDTVYAGSVIGRVGSTGNSTGSHLHFEVWVNGTRIDPMQFF